MRRLSRRGVLGGGAGLAALGADGARAAAGPPVLVTPTQLQAWMARPNLVLMHVGEAGDYAAGHLPGARLLGRGALAISGAAAGGLVLELPSAEELHAQLQALGVTDRSRVVVYAAGGEVQAATRVMYTLDAAGLGDRSALLDGGLAAWKRESRPVTIGVPPPVVAGALSPLRLRPRAVTAEALQARIGKPGFTTIDARAPVFFDGSQPGGAQGPNPRKGHLPGALNVPYTAVTAADGRFKSASELRELFAGAGVRRGDKVAVYCHVGQQATAVMFAARRAGIDAELYDGSFQDWARRGLPLEDPSAAKAPPPA